MSFCGGRVDAEDADGSGILAPRSYSTGCITVKDDMQVKGLTKEQGVALFAAPKDGSTTLSNEYFANLKVGDGDHTEEERALLEGEFGPIVDLFIADEEFFLSKFAKAWTYMMTADRFAEGPFKNACDGVDAPTLA